MITVKKDSEIELLRKSAKILSKTLTKCREWIKAGVSTFDIDKKCHDFILENGAIPSCLGYEGYPASVCASVNETVVHGIPSKDIILKDGDIITIDMCVTYEGMVSDAARTFYVGQVSDEVKKLCEVTRESFFKGIENIKNGARVSDIGHQVQQYVEGFGFGVVRELTGHGVGYDVHEDPFVPNYGKAHKGPVLQTNMVIAVEPMITLGDYAVFMEKDGWTIKTCDGKPAAHYENTIVIKDDGVEILTLEEDEEIPMV